MVHPHLAARCCPGLLTSRNRQRCAEDPDGECCTFLQVGGLCKSSAPRRADKLRGPWVMQLRSANLALNSGFFQTIFNIFKLFLLFSLYIGEAKQVSTK